MKHRREHSGLELLLLWRGRNDGDWTRIRSTFNSLIGNWYQTHCTHINCHTHTPHMILQALLSGFLAGLVVVVVSIVIEKYGGVFGGVLASTPTTIIAACVG